MMARPGSCSLLDEGGGAIELRRLLDLSSRLIVATMLGLAGCSATSVPEIYHGRTGRVVLAVPSRIAFSVLYNGESDWEPPEKPRSERTDRDPIQGIEFWIDLDQPSVIMADQAARNRLAQRASPPAPPEVFGHVIGIIVDFSANEPSAASIRSYWSRGEPYFAPAFRALVAAPPEYGLETRRADWSKPVKGREMHGSGLFDVDVDYLSEPDNIYLFCNDGRQVVPPFAPMATCGFKIVVPELGAMASGQMDRKDVPRWRDLRTAVLLTLRSFVVRRGALPPR